MKRMLVICGLLSAVAGNAFAQYSGSSSSSSGSEHKADIVVLGGYAFTMGQDVVLNYTDAGELDVDDAPFFGVALDFNLVRQPGKEGQLRLLWRREDSDATFQSFTPGGINRTRECSFEYYQIGGVGGVRKGNVLPFGSVTLGATRLAVEGTDDWKFSMIFGLGAKIYSSGKIGFMIQGNWALTFTDAWGSATFGTGGAGIGISGTGISQLDIGGGVLIQL